VKGDEVSSPFTYSDTDDYFHYLFYFGIKLYMFRTVPLSIISSLFSVHSAMEYAIQVYRQLTSRIRMELQFHPGPARRLSTNLYDIYHC